MASCVSTSRQNDVRLKTKIRIIDKDYRQKMIHERYFLQLHKLCVSGKEKCWLLSSLCQLQVNYAKIVTIQIATYKFLYTAQIKLNGVHILPNKFNVRQWQAIYCLRALFSSFTGTSFAVYIIFISQLFKLLHSNDAYFWIINEVCKRERNTVFF